MMFQSPGGRKFVKFLSILSSFVLKHCLMKELAEQSGGVEQEVILHKPAVSVAKNSRNCNNNKELRKLQLKNFVQLDSRACSAAGETLFSLKF
jgi:hypothetical protein